MRLTGHPAVISGDTPPDTAKDLNSNPHPTRSRTTLAGPCSLLSPRVLEGGIGVLILKRGSQAGRRGQGGQPWFPAQASTLRGPGCRLTLSVSKPSGLGAGSSRQRGLVCLRVRLPRWVPAGQLGRAPYPSASGVEGEDSGRPGLGETEGWLTGSLPTEHRPPDLATHFPEASFTPGTRPHPVRSEALQAPGRGPRACRAAPAPAWLSGGLGGGGRGRGAAAQQSSSGDAVLPLGPCQEPGTDVSLPCASRPLPSCHSNLGAAPVTRVSPCRVCGRAQGALADQPLPTLPSSS